MSTFDLYGLGFSSLDAARDAIEQTLRITMSPHESSYRGGDYYAFGEDVTENLILQRNYDDISDEWTLPNSKESTYLLYVNNTQRAEELESRLANVGRLLSRRVL
jgi:hypothetical protein